MWDTFFPARQNVESNGDPAGLSANQLIAFMKAVCKTLEKQSKANAKKKHNNKAHSGLAPDGILSSNCYRNFEFRIQNKNEFVDLKLISILNLLFVV